MSLRRSHTVSTQEAELKALQKASRTAMSTGTLPGTFRSIVTMTTVAGDSFRRVAHEVERRSVVLRTTPAAGARKRDESPLPDPRSIDPWAADPHGLPATTLTISSCPSCLGEKKITCPACAGAGRVRCRTCSGGGKVRGQRGLKNCGSCRGTGTRKCSHCRHGRVTCPHCEGKGRVNAWLENEQQRSVQVRVHPTTGAASLHRDITSIANFDCDPSTYRSPLAHDSGWIETLPDPLGADLGADLHPVTDRILRQRIQRFEGKVYKFAYTTRVGDGVIAVTGNPPGVLPESQWRPLKIRLFAAMGLGFILFIVGSVVESNYSHQTQWFMAHGNGPAMALFGFAAAIAGGVALAGNLLPAPARTFVRSKLPLVLMVFAWSIIGVLHVVGGPAIEGVQTALERRDLYAAQTEIEALEAVGLVSGELNDARAQLETMKAEEKRLHELAEDEAHLVRVRSAKSSVEAIAVLELAWNEPEHTITARDVVLAKANADLDTLFNSTDQAGLRELAKAVEPFDTSLAAKALSRQTLSQAEVCHTKGDIDCAITSLNKWTPIATDDEAKDKHDALRQRVISELIATIDSAEVKQDDLDARIAALEKASADVLRLAEIAPEVSAPRSLGSLQRLTERAQAADQKRKKSEARTARRAAEKAAREDERIRRNADRVRCCDGSGSGCRYSQGSLRGCCSHHGGVC